MLVVAVLVLVVLILLYLAWSSKKALYESVIAGLWEGDEAFLNQAGLTNMVVYIGPDLGGKFSELRRAYIIMTTMGVVTFQKIAYLNLSGFVGFFGESITKILTLTDDAEGNVEDGPIQAGLDTSDSISVGKVITAEPLECTLNLGRGCMVWENSENLYARLFRNYRDDTGAEEAGFQESEL